MAEWLPIDSNLPTKPEVRRICRKTGEDTATVIGRLVMFWGQVDQHGDLLDEAERPTDRPDLDGIVPDYELDDLLDICGGDEDFWNVVCETGWLAIDERGLLITGFEKRFGTSAKQRAEAARRQQRKRMRDNGVIGTTPKAKAAKAPSRESMEPKQKPHMSRDGVTRVTPSRDESVTRESKRVRESESEERKINKDHENDADASENGRGREGKRELPWQTSTDQEFIEAVRQRKPARIEDHWREAVKAGWMQDTQHLRHRFYSAICYGVRDPKINSVKALLVYRLKKNDWRTGTDECDREAKKLIAIEDGRDQARISNLAVPQTPVDTGQRRADAIAQLAAR